MKSSFLKKVEHTSNLSLIRLNRKGITFIICLLISVFFWLLLMLSKEYTVSYSFPVKYLNVPNDKIISDYLPETVGIELKSKGFNFLGFMLREKLETIQIDLKDARPSRLKNYYYLSTNSRLDKIAKQFRSSINVLRMNPDTIYLNYNRKITKIVPVKSNLVITFANQYQLADSIKYIPDVVQISGAEDVVKKIDYVETVSLKKENIDKSIKIKLAISQTPDLKYIELSQKEIVADIEATKFTEGIMELPVTVENLPSSYNLKIFPDKIAVKYHVTFQDYDKINVHDFRAIVDYKTMENSSNKLKVQLVKYPSRIKSIKYSPEKVEYILRK